MTWTAVGSFGDVQAATFSLTPNTVGNLICLDVANFSNSTVFASSVASSNVTWTAVGHYLGVTNTGTHTLFLGTVTSTSTATVTPTWSGTAPAGIQFDYHEFHSTVGSWAVDTFTHLDNAGTLNWPTLTPTNSGELYWGYAFNATSAVGGSTSGYVYNVGATTGNGQAYNLNCAAGVATGPVWGAGDGGEQLGMMMLVAETAGVGTGAPPQPGSYQWQRHNRPAQQVPQMQPVAPPPAPPGGIPQPGSRFWQTTWRKAQTIPQAPANPAPAPAVTPPLATPPRIVRPVQRAIAKGQPGGTNPALGVTPSDGLPRIPHPQPVRAIGKGEPGTANHAFANPPLWQPQPRPRPYQRAIGKGQPGGTNQTPAIFTVTPPPPQPRPRPFQRVLWKGGAGPGNHGIGETPSAGLPRIPHPQPYRAVWRNGAGPPNHAFANPPLWQPQPRRPGPVRAIGNGVLGPGNQSFTFVAVGPPLWQAQPRRPGPVRAIATGNTNEPHLVAPPVLTRGTEFGDDESRRGWLKKRFVLEAM